MRLFPVVEHPQRPQRVQLQLDRLRLELRLHLQRLGLLLVTRARPSHRRRIGLVIRPVFWIHQHPARAVRSHRGACVATAPVQHRSIPQHFHRLGAILRCPGHSQLSEQRFHALLRRLTFHGHRVTIQFRVQIHARRHLPSRRRIRLLHGGPQLLLHGVRLSPNLLPLLGRPLVQARIIPALVLGHRRIHLGQFIPQLRTRQGVELLINLPPLSLGDPSGHFLLFLQHTSTGVNEFRRPLQLPALGVDPVHLGLVLLLKRARLLLRLLQLRRQIPEDAHLAAVCRGVFDQVRRLVRLQQPLRIARQYIVHLGIHRLRLLPQRITPRLPALLALLKVLHMRVQRLVQLLGRQPLKLLQHLRLIGLRIIPLQHQPRQPSLALLIGQRIIFRQSRNLPLNHRFPYRFRFLLGSASTPARSGSGLRTGSASLQLALAPVPVSGSG